MTTNPQPDARARLVAAIRSAPFQELRAESPNGPLVITARVDDLADAVLRAAAEPDGAGLSGPWWTADDRLKPHALPAATVPDQPPMTGGFDASIEIPDLPAVSVPASAPTDRTALRDRIAEVLTTTSRAEWPYTPGQEKFDHHKHGERPGHTYSISCALCTGDVDRLADAAVAVLPTPADRAAVLREIAEWLDGCNPDRGAEFSDGVDWATSELRRLADVAAASGSGRVADETQAAPYPPVVEWRTETQRRDDHWSPWCGGRYELDEARADFAETVATDRGRHAWRLVRATTTYAVEVEQPAVVSQPDGEA